MKSSSASRTGKEEDKEEVPGAHRPPSTTCLSSLRRWLPAHTRLDRPGSAPLLTVSLQPPGLRVPTAPWPRWGARPGSPEPG